MFIASASYWRVPLGSSCVTVLVTGHSVQPWHYGSRALRAQTPLMPSDGVVSYEIASLVSCAHLETYSLIENPAERQTPRQVTLTLTLTFLQRSRLPLVMVACHDPTNENGHPHDHATGRSARRMSRTNPAIFLPPVESGPPDQNLTLPPLLHPWMNVSAAQNGQIDENNAPDCGSSGVLNDIQISTWDHHRILKFL